MALTLALAKQHLEYEDDDRNDLIEQYIEASAAWVENYTGKALSAGVVVQTVTGFPSYIVLSRGPVASLTSIQYVDTDDEPQSVTGARLVSGRVYAPVGGWPSAAEYAPITITYQAGFATPPADLVSAQLLLVGHWFANREAGTDRAISEVPFAVESLCLPYRELMV